MSTSENIKDRLKSIGFNDEQVEIAIRDVSKIILDKALIFWFNKLSYDQKESMKNIPPDKQADYFRSNPDFPQLSLDEFKAIEKDTWSDYFHTFSA